MNIVSNNPDPKPMRPYCNKCGWRKGGPDSWNGVTCKCGHDEPVIRRVEDRDE